MWDELKTDARFCRMNIWLCWTKFGQNVNKSDKQRTPFVFVRHVTLGVQIVTHIKESWWHPSYSWGMVLKTMWVQSNLFLRSYDSMTMIIRTILCILWSYLWSPVTLMSGIYHLLTSDIKASVASRWNVPLSKHLCWCSDDTLKLMRT